MSQHDFEIANQTSLSARTDINNGLQALASNNSGASSPSTTYANMLWYDTSNNILKMRNEANSTWIDVAYINQSTGVTSILDNTPVVTSGGATAGLLGDQLSSVWNTGTGTTESLISPAKLKGAVDNLTVSSPIKAWANINGINGTIRASSGLSGCVRNSRGYYTVTFNTNLMPDANYVLTGSAGSAIGDNRASLDIYTLAQTTASFTVTNHGNLYRGDHTFVCVQFVR
tara:strand:+ start:224 stop:910 length:687 start_codon:yes stop_codon:yes gene_type:complete